MGFKIIFELWASALLGYIQAARRSTLTPNGDSSRYSIYTATSTGRWCVSGSKVAVWKPWNEGAHPDFSICPMWDKTLALLTAVDSQICGFPLCLCSLIVNPKWRDCFHCKKISSFKHCCFCQSEFDAENEFNFVFTLSLMNFSNMVYYGNLTTILCYWVGI